MALWSGASKPKSGKQMTKLLAAVERKHKTNAPLSNHQGQPHVNPNSHPASLPAHLSSLLAGALPLLCRLSARLGQQQQAKEGGVRSTAANGRGSEEHSSQWKGE
jgi:hypothetical protein